MNLQVLKEQAEHNWETQMRLNKRIRTLEDRCGQLEMDVVMLHAIITNLNEALAEQKIKPLPSGKNSPVFYQQMA